jgi:hypothetical protein
LLRSSSDMRARLDRVPSLVRRGTGRLRGTDPRPKG